MSTLSATLLTAQWGPGLLSCIFNLKFHKKIGEKNSKYFATFFFTKSFNFLIRLQFLSIVKKILNDDSIMQFFGRERDMKYVNGKRRRSVVFYSDETLDWEISALPVCLLDGFGTRESQSQSFEEIESELSNFERILEFMAIFLNWQ